MGRPAYPIIGWSNAGTNSDMFKCDGNQLVGFIVPATFVSTSVTFQMTPSTGTNPIVWYPVTSSAGTAISFTTTTLTAKYYGFTQDQTAQFTGAEVIRMVTGSSEVVSIPVRFVIVPRQY